MITSLYASLLAFLYFKISMTTVRARTQSKISLGTGPNNEIQKYVSAHSNFASYVPLFLVLFFLAESSNIIPNLVLYLLGFIFFIARLLHFKTLTAKKMNFKSRRLSMIMTLLSINLLAVSNLVIFIKATFL